MLAIYAGDGNILDKKIVSYIREGDLVSTIAESIGIQYEVKAPACLLQLQPCYTLSQTIDIKGLRPQQVR